MTRKTIKFHLVKKTSLLSFQMPSKYLKHHSEVKTSGNCSDIKSRTDDIGLSVRIRFKDIALETPAFMQTYIENNNCYSFPLSLQKIEYQYETQ